MELSQPVATMSPFQNIKADDITSATLIIYSTSSKTKPERNPYLVCYLFNVHSSYFIKNGPL